MVLSFSILWLGCQNKQASKKPGLTFLPITPTNPTEETDSLLYDIQLSGLRDPESQGKNVLITKHHHESSDLDAATNHYWLS